MYATTASAATFSPSSIKPPAPQREFRAGWVATVGNIDWPSKSGLPVEEQKAELIAILDRSAKLKLNAVVLQVRPSCDALYASKIEPWSAYLTGTMGKAPEPFYDPLTFAVEEAHKRGLELHAWFNPYRAAVKASKSPIAANHISKTHPELVRDYGKYLWLDPGEKAVQDYSLSVILDVVKRYDIDGVHMDDYFYPYKEQDAQKHNMDFPDEASWKKYGTAGKLSRDDWRRENVNVFVERLYKSIKATKPWVKLGISPFGIWQPGYPQQIKGFNAYEVLYCDSRKWLENGWLDYCTPQLYWAIQPPEQSYTALLKWWTEQNPKHRNIWPGIDTGKFKNKPEEIENQIKIARQLCSGTAGHVHWSFKSLMPSRGEMGNILESGLYSEPAIIPASPWLANKAPGKPKLTVAKEGKVTWQGSASDKISVWVLQTKSGDKWQTTVLPGATSSHTVPDSLDAVALTAVNRFGSASQPMVLQKAGSAK
ncbi:MAG: hypothetical protein JWQ71_2425 [Pedosphaera sp.]|nr:hypothetical protein [Pedosphaera sp.]